MSGQNVIVVIIFAITVFNGIYHILQNSIYKLNEPNWFSKNFENYFHFLNVIIPNSKSSWTYFQTCPITSPRRKFHLKISISIPLAQIDDEINFKFLQADRCMLLNLINYRGWFLLYVPQFMCLINVWIYRCILVLMAWITNKISDSGSSNLKAT